MASINVKPNWRKDIWGITIGWPDDSIEYFIIYMFKKMID